MSTLHTRALACIAAWPDAYDEERCPQIMAFARFVTTSPAPEAAIVLAEQACAAEQERQRAADAHDYGTMNAMRETIERILWTLGHAIGDTDAFYGVKP